MGASPRDGPFPSPISYSSNSPFKTQDAAPPQPSLSLLLCCLAGPARVLALQGHTDDCASRETDPEAKAQRYPNIQAMTRGRSLKEKKLVPGPWGCLRWFLLQCFLTMHRHRARYKPLVLRFTSHIKTKANVQTNIKNISRTNKSTS